MAAIAEFFVSHIEFLSFFIMSSPCISVDTLLLEFKRHGVEGLDDVIGADCFIKSMPKYITCIFVCTTFVPFILGRKGGRVNSCSQDDRSFSSGLADLVYRGAYTGFQKKRCCGILRILFFLVCGGVESRNSNFNTDIIGEIK